MNDEKKAYTPQENKEASTQVEGLLKQVSEICHKYDFSLIAITAAERCDENNLDNVTSCAVMGGNGGKIIQMVANAMNSDEGFEAAILESSKTFLEERNPLFKMMAALSEMGGCDCKPGECKNGCKETHPGSPVQEEEIIDNIEKFGSMGNEGMETKPQFTLVRPTSRGMDATEAERSAYVDIDGSPVMEIEDAIKSTSEEKLEEFAKANNLNGYETMEVPAPVVVEGLGDAWNSKIDLLFDGSTGGNFRIFKNEGRVVIEAPDCTEETITKAEELVNGSEVFLQVNKNEVQKLVQFVFATDRKNLALPTA